MLGVMIATIHALSNDAVVNTITLFIVVRQALWQPIKLSSLIGRLEFSLNDPQRPQTM